MIPISPRFFAPLLAALLLAAVPVTLHYIIGYQVDDCADPEALRRLSIAGITNLREDVERYSSSVIQYSEGTIGGGLPFRVVRAFQPQRFYEEWPDGMPGRKFFYSPKLEWVKAGGIQLPIATWRQQYYDEVRVAAMLLIYSSQPVENLFWSSAAHAMSRLIGGVPAVTMIGVNGYAAEAGVDEVEALLRTLLVEFWNYYAEVCEAPCTLDQRTSYGLKCGTLAGLGVEASPPWLAERRGSRDDSSRWSCSIGSLERSSPRIPV